MIQPEPFNRFRFRRYARELSRAVYELSQPMSIQIIREALKHLPGAETTTMSYGNGGATHIFTMGDVSVEVGASASFGEIEAAFVEAKKNYRTDKPV